MKTPPLSIEALMVLDAIEYRGSYAAAAEVLGSEKVNRLWRGRWSD